MNTTLTVRAKTKPAIEQGRVHKQPQKTRETIVTMENLVADADGGPRGVGRWTLRTIGTGCCNTVATPSYSYQYIHTVTVCSDKATAYMLRGKLNNQSYIVRNMHENDYNLKC